MKKIGKIFFWKLISLYEDQENLPGLFNCCLFAPSVFSSIIWFLQAVIIWLSHCSMIFDRETVTSFLTNGEQSLADFISFIAMC